MGELHPNHIIRKRDGPKWFGLGPSQIDEKVKNDPEFPKPFPLSDSGRATGWTGAQIIEHQRRLQELQAARAAAAAKEMEGVDDGTS